MTAETNPLTEYVRGWDFLCSTCGREMPSWEWWMSYDECPECMADRARYQSARAAMRQRRGM